MLAELAERVAVSLVVATPEVGQVADRGGERDEVDAPERRGCCQCVVHGAHETAWLPVTV